MIFTAVFLAFAVPLAAAKAAKSPYVNYDNYQQKPYNSYDDSYNSYQKPNYNNYNQDYNSYDNSYSSSYKSPYGGYDNSYDNSYKPSKSYDNYNQYPSNNYDSYSPSYNQPKSYDNYNSYDNSYKQPSYKSSYDNSYDSYAPSYNKQPAYNSYQAPQYPSNDYKQQYPSYCPPLQSLNLVKPLGYGNIVQYVGDTMTAFAFCGNKDPAVASKFFVRCGTSCAVINERSAGLEESLEFTCQNGQWLLMAGSSPSMYITVGSNSIICAAPGDTLNGCSVADPADGAPEGDLEFCLHA